jgi:crossover junction endodeoxyribonuclease RusA
MPSFKVHGRPIPQGSMKGFIMKGRGGGSYVALTSANTKTEPWRQEVAAAAIKARVPHVSLGPLRLTVVFALPRPISRPKKFQSPDKRPDLDKLLRAILDALTGIAFRDDAQVCEIRASKVYARHLGAAITVTPLLGASGPIPGPLAVPDSQEEPHDPTRPRGADAVAAPPRQRRRRLRV